MKNPPSISIVTCTLNPDIPIFEKVLKAIRLQNYPQDLIEHIVMDGGSVNGATELARRYHCDVTVRKDLMIKAEERAGMGLKNAKGDLILSLQADNILTSKNWLREMVEPFLNNKKIFCTFSAYNDYKKNMSLTTRYGALFGTADPMLYYMGKSDKISLMQKKYNRGNIIGETSRYWIIEFNKDTLPTLGDNGHMFLRKAINQVNRDPKSYLHPDAFVMMLDLGYNTCGVIKNSVIHIIPSNIFYYAKRRIWTKETYYDGRRGKRKYLVFNWRSHKDQLNLIKLVFFSLTFIFPLLESIKGYIKIRDAAWFLHPFASLVMVVCYGYSESRYFYKRLRTYG